MNEFRVYLRALEPDDYKLTVKWRNDDEIWAAVGGPKYFVSAEYERQWFLKAINASNEIRLGICLKENDQLIGLSSIIDIDWINKSAQSQILIGEKKYWGIGIGAEASLLLLRFVFYERGFERIWAHILESNIASVKMHEKSGYKREGLLRNAGYKNGSFHNMVVMSTLRHEFDELEKKKR